MLERTLIYVDTSYLLASFYNAWETGARAQLEIDLPEVVSVLDSRAVDQLHQPVHRQNWYDGIPETGPHRYQRALRSCNGVQLRSGQLIEWGDRRTQKAVDTRLVADMVISALSGDVTDIILVSGDADMLPGVDEAVSRGVRVHLYGFGWDSMSANLRYSCDSTTILDPREDFADCMRLQVLEGPLKSGTAKNPPSGDSAGTSADAPAGNTDVPATPDGTGGHRQKPIGDAEPVEDLTGTCAVPDVRRKAATPTPGIRAAASQPDTAPPADDATAAPAPAAPTGPAADSGSGDGDGDGDGTDETDATAATELAGSSTDESSAQPRPSSPASPADLAGSRPTPAMMAPRRRLRSRYVPLPTEVWQSGGQQNPFDIGEQYAVWWFQNAASDEQKDNAHVLCGGGLPPAVDRPLLQFACDTLHEYTLTEYQRVNLRDGFHSGIRGILLNR